MKVPPTSWSIQVYISVGAKEYRATQILYYITVTDSLMFHTQRINIF